MKFDFNNEELDIINSYLLFFNIFRRPFCFSINFILEKTGALIKVNSLKSKHIYIAAIALIVRHKHT